ncbi:type II secretion system F family protein [Microbacterium sp. KUDC0406]|uniref:type II secretion system F family protein n=1 Tax=Microbacterium sp. KUDC0406 TaxID=2909588 RepID=UPI001F269251|nr:type II secretion system F family protein [Microbacterium sp. KUDC0406]UJP10280.1 type II secretion system F family protein [Microbacterium sp. KUDC0406]
MPVEEYSYRAVGSGGGAIVKGSMEAASENAVVGKLRAQGLLPLEVVPVSKTGLNQEIPWFEKRVTLDDLAVLTKQLAGLIDAGLPLLRALSVLIDQTENKKLVSALTAVHSDIEGGKAFSAALSAHPAVFPPLMISLVRVGETGGFLGGALKSVATSYRSDVDLQQKIKSALTYPIIVLIIAVLGVTAMLTFIVPIFQNMFESMGGELPLPTQILVSLSANMTWILPLMAVLIIVGTVWYRRVKDTDRFRGVVDPIKLRLPVFGTLITKIAVARFARNLSMMLQAGVPLLQALEIVGKAANNRAIELALVDVSTSISQGRSFSRPLEDAAVFPPLVAQMVSVGEEAGTLPDMLESIADFYEAEVKTASEQLTSTIEPILITLLGVIIGGMVVALYMPIFGMYDQLGKQ